jgi:hypothetical protein
MDELDSERKQIAKQIHHHTRDTLLERIASVFDTGVGVKPTTEDLDVMFKEGEKRFEQKIPPGYEDEKDKKDNRKYGDYVLWRQLMNHAAQDKRDLIFVTDDNKADWWLKDDDRKTSLAPRPELIQEFRDVTGQEILILNSERFYYALVPAADDNSDQSKQVMAAQEDMKAAVSEAEEEPSLYDKLKAIAESDTLRDSFIATSRAEQARLRAEIEYLTDRKEDIERRLSFLPQDSASRSRLIEQELHPMLERRDLLRERWDMFNERLEAYERRR